MATNFEAILPEVDAVKSNTVQQNIVGGGDEEEKSNKRKRRHRPATKGARNELRILIENAILDANSSLLPSVFTSKEDGTLNAPLASVLSHLNLADSPKFSGLSTFALKSISNRTRVFRIEENALDGGNLWVYVEPKACTGQDEKTVYVDNLPLVTNNVRLARRASLFGSVVGVHLPQIARIQRRLAQMLGCWPAHSGFGFVQFASKTAAKRFCKRYATNSRLKRIHHHHGQKHAKRRATVTAILPGQEETPKKAQGQVTVPVPASTANNSSVFNTSACSTVSGNTVECGRVRSYSVTEESTMSESGNETDTNMASTEQLDRRRGRGTKAKKKSETTKKRRRRRVPSVRQPPGQSLNAIHRHIQVFPLKHYRELRADYLRLKRTRLCSLKRQLLASGRGEEDAKEKGQNERCMPEDKEKEQEPSATDADGKRTKPAAEKRRRKRRGKRGVRRLMEKAESAKMRAQCANEDGSVVDVL